MKRCAIMSFTEHSGAPEFVEAVTIYLLGSKAFVRLSSAP